MLFRSFPTFDQALQAQRPPEIRALRPAIEMDTLPLYRAVYNTPDPDPLRQLEMKIELHQRMALPVA